jgi:release factor glutamine methyltransferase
VSPRNPQEEARPRIWTIAEVLRWTQGRFVSAGLSSPRLDAELLLCHALGRPRVALYTHHDQPLSPEELAGYRELIRRRLQGEPVAYLVGQREFWSLSLRVSADVLVPRPETEILVEVALALLAGQQGARSMPETRQETRPETRIEYEEVQQELPEPGPGPEEAQAAEEGPQEAAQAAPEAAVAAAPSGAAPAVPAPRIADIGTGSGAVALALKKEQPAAQVFAVERSPAALAVARDNAARLGLAVEFLEGDLLAPLRGLPPFTLIVSNPPYIPRPELPHLPPEVRAEPVLALDGGGDGLEVIRRLVAAAPACLDPGGALALEVGAGQAAAVEDLLRQAGFQQVGSTPDLARIPRVVSGRRPASS